MDLHESAVVEVVITEVREFGVLVEFEGRKGLIELPDVSWNSDDVKPLMAAITPGQRVEVKVTGFVPGHFPQEFSASLKHIHPELDPWIDPGIYAEGTLHSGFVRTIFDFGAALIVLTNGAHATIESLRPGTRLNDPLSIVVKTVDAKRQTIKAEQI